MAALGRESVKVTVGEVASCKLQVTSCKLQRRKTLSGSESVTIICVSLPFEEGERGRERSCNVGHC